MVHFISLAKKITNWLQQSGENLNISGVSSNQWAFLLDQLVEQKDSIINKTSQLIICPDFDSAERFHTSLRQSNPERAIFLFPGLEESPYSEIYASTSNLYRRFKILDKISRDIDSSMIVITTPEACFLKGPPASFFRENSFEIRQTDIISPDDLARRLIAIGYLPATSVEEAGTFVRKGEIFDIYPVSERPVRLHYYDDMVEEIFLIDPITQKTLRDQSRTTVFIAPTPNIFVNKEFRDAIRKNIPMPGPQNKVRHECRKCLLEQLNAGQLFDNYPSYVSLFFESPVLLLDYFNFAQTIVHVIQNDRAFREFQDYGDQISVEHDQKFTAADSDLLLPAPAELYEMNLGARLKDFRQIYVDDIKLNLSLQDDLRNNMVLNFESAQNFVSRHINSTSDRYQYIKQMLGHLKTFFAHSGSIIYSSRNENSLQEMRYLLEQNEFDADLIGRVSFQRFNLEDSFYYDAEKIFVCGDGDFFTRRQQKAKKQANMQTDLFAEQLGTIKKGDYLVHNDFGIGEYLGLESLEINGIKSDFLVIMYAEQDKVYVPVYRLNIVSKHADASASQPLASLRNNKFLALKARAKSSAKKLAFNLLELQAQRQSNRAHAFSAPEHTFQEFELVFPFEETADQKSAICNVIEAMQKNTPMDHLVCGDVGFGKTEVAARAAFLAVLDQKQVAILVPTTLLAMQHYHSFCERFKNFPVKIEFLSRFKSAVESKQIREELQQGKIDIIIGTHKLLATNIAFKDLGLVVVDEEHKFGVNHKEKLKLLKSTVDFLTLTATPIPRTLQLAFLGLRDLSLIQTAPPRRQSIKSYIIKEDDETIKLAIEKEIKRGGQVFFVHNRVMDIEHIAQRLRQLLPDAKMIIAHGQLSEKELEGRMQSFYSGKYQILICTTIIESGLDIANANTMIIDRADTYGLAQLHQLRGRIGRSDKKAYAYFMIPKSKNLSNIAETRLKALQTYTEIGSGFSLASCDLEIRGAGDILGAEQSGHIEAIGLELYLELLKEAIDELKGQGKIAKQNIEINTPFPALIPSNYIASNNKRLKQYKKLANCESFEQLECLKEEMLDIYGHFPQETENLFLLLEVRLLLQHCGLESIQVSSKAICLKFAKELVDSNKLLQDKIISTFVSHPKKYRVYPDYRVEYGHHVQITQKDLLNFAKDIAQQIVLC